jgi:hypothetical protein
MASAPQQSGAPAVPAASAAKDADPDEAMESITRVFSSPTGTVSDADRTSLIAQLVASAGLSQADAERQVQHWEQVAAKAKEQFAAMKADAERTAREEAASAAKSLSAAAWLAFVATALAATAAMLGAHVGGLGAIASRTHLLHNPLTPHVPVKI